MKTTEELNTIKEELETLNEKLVELTDEELAQVTGGIKIDVENAPEWIRTIADLFFKIP